MFSKEVILQERFKLVEGIALFVYFFKFYLVVFLFLTDL